MTSAPQRVQQLALIRRWVSSRKIPVSFLKANVDAVAKALKEGGNKDYTVEEFPGLNNLFQTCETGCIDRTRCGLRCPPLV
jgi:hypothetical protein